MKTKPRKPQPSVESLLRTLQRKWKHTRTIELYISRDGWAQVGDTYKREITRPTLRAALKAAVKGTK